jgi:methionyl-tRNA synthetase
VLRSLAVALWPIIPRSAEKLWDQLGLPGKVREQPWSQAGEARVPGGLEVRSADPLFTKVPDEVIEEELAGLAEQAAAAAPAGAEAKGPELPPAKPAITYDEFSKLDLRVGKILAAEPVPKAKRLLKLSVDTGLDQRTVVAGIAEHYSAEELIGRKVIVLVNLEPRALRGVESKGMLLAADLEGRPFLLSASDDAPVGSPIK